MCLVVNKNYKSEKNYSLSFSSLRRDVQISHLIKKKKYSNMNKLYYK